MRIVDLSFPIRPHFRWKVEPTLVRSHAAGDVFQSTVLTVACHAYTHVDAPVHFLPGDRDIASMPVDQWMGEAALVDLTHLGDNGEVTAAELDAHAGHVRRGDIALLRTDWPRKVSVESEKFWRDAPYTGRSACDWLVRRGVKAVGYDYPPDYTVRTSIFEPGVQLTPEQCTTHHVFFPAGVTVIEYLANLDQVGVARCRFIALPLRIEGADGSPVRAIALVGELGAPKWPPQTPQTFGAPRHSRVAPLNRPNVRSGPAQPGRSSNPPNARSASGRLPLELPRREAADVDVVLVQPGRGSAAVTRELDLELHLGGPHRKLADRTGGADARTAPRAIGGAAGELAVLKDRARPLAKSLFIHLAVPQEVSNGRPSQMPRGSTPDAPVGNPGGGGTSLSP